MAAPVRRGSAGLAAMITSRNDATAPPIPSKLPSVVEEEPSIPPAPMPQHSNVQSSNAAALKPVTSIFERVDETVPPVPSSSNSISPNSKPPSAAAASSSIPAGLNSNRCPVCDKSVYKVEEVLASGRTWHKSCFRCSPFSKDGCNRVLTRDKYLDHEKEPYCNACFDKLWKPKGYGFAGAFSATTSDTNSSSSYGRTSDLSAEEVDAVKSLSISSPSTPSGETNSSSSAPTRRASGTSQNLAASILTVIASTTPTTKAAPPVTTATPSYSSSSSSSAAPIAKGGAFRRPSVADSRAIHAEMGTPIAPEPVVQSSKCPVCDKSVYKVEEVLASGRTWHKSCFRCSPFSKDGCSKVLTRDKYLDHEKEPYCNACYDKLWKPKGYGFAGAFSATTSDSNSNAITASSSSASLDKSEPVRRTSTYTGSVFAGTSAVSQPSSTPAPSTASAAPKFVNSAAEKVKVATASGPTCTICTKAVYKMEEVIALGRTYHKTCFTCSGRAGDGCGRTLKLGEGYLEHANQPYCKSCYDKLWKPKGYGTGTTSSTLGGAEEVNAAKTALASTPSSAPAGPTFVFDNVPPQVPLPVKKPSASTAPILVLAPKKTQAANPLGFSDAELAVLQQPGEREERDSMSGRGSMSGPERRPSLSSKDIGLAYSGGNDEVDDQEW